MRVAITGAQGFLGWHLRARLSAVGGHEVIPVSRSLFESDDGLGRALEKADAVIHLAGINRDAPEVVEAGNVWLAERLVGALDGVGSAPFLIYANSVHASGDTPYGRGKRRAAAILSNWADRAGTAMIDIVLQNLFGEGGRPDYNSFVATFCYQLARDHMPRVGVDRTVQLIHAQDAASLVVERLNEDARSTVVETAGRTVLVSEVRQQLAELAATYAGGRIPDLSDPFVLRLFNTYRSFLYPQWYPQPLAPKSDCRGDFVEAVQVAGGQGQTSFSTTRPGVTRGNHFHLRKVERFVVLRGRARVATRPAGTDQLHTFDLSGDQPAFVDMPTLHSHSITNTGSDELWTLFWVSELFDEADADTFAGEVA